FGADLPVQGSSCTALAMARGPGAGEAAGAAAECLDAGRSAKTPCADAGSEVADGEPALRRWPAPARVPEAARQGRGLRVPADARAGRPRRQGPRHQDRKSTRLN